MSQTQLVSISKKIWQPIWKRADSASEENLESWQSFIQEMQDVNIPNFNFQSDLRNPEIYGCPPSIK